MFVFVLFKDKKKALAMTIVLGALLALLAAMFVPAIASGKLKSPPKYELVEAVVLERHVRVAGEASSWTEYRFTCEGRERTARVDGPYGEPGEMELIYVNPKNLNDIRVISPSKTTNMAMLPWLVISPVALLFAITLANYLSVSKKAKRDANS
jgi:hypothetical protein